MSTSAPKVRSPSTLRRLMKEADNEMARLVKRRDLLHGQLAEAGTDHVELTRLGREETVVSEQLADAEERWMALAEEAEWA